MNKQLKKKTKKGFTLIELIVVIAILGILAAILVPVIGGIIEDANRRVNEANARSLFSAINVAVAMGHDYADSSDTDFKGIVSNYYGAIPSDASWTSSNGIDNVRVTVGTGNIVGYYPAS